jgi:hypothetical protein
VEEEERGRPCTARVQDRKSVVGGRGRRSRGWGCGAATGCAAYFGHAGSTGPHHHQHGAPQRAGMCLCMGGMCVDAAGRLAKQLCTQTTQVILQHLAEHLTATHPSTLLIDCSAGTAGFNGVLNADALAAVRYWVVARRLRLPVVRLCPCRSFNTTCSCWWTFVRRISRNWTLGSDMSRTAPHCWAGSESDWNRRCGRVCAV